MSTLPLNANIYVAGHLGLAGSAVWRKLKSLGYANLIGRTSKDLDLTSQADVKTFFKQTQPEYVILAAAKVGGILANSTYPADFIYRNLMIQTNVIHAAKEHHVKRLIFLGSSCIYPKLCPQPIKEEYLLTGPLEITNRPYAIAKIAGIEQCWAYNRQYGTHYLAVMPTNLYGPGDNYNLQTSHVLPAIMRKMHEGKINQAQVELWGKGSVKREFLHVDDLAGAIVHLLKLPEETFAALCASAEEPPIINVGCGEDVTIKELAHLTATVTGYTGTILWNPDKPEGTPRKLLDVSRLKRLGWSPSIPLSQGLKHAYEAMQTEIYA
jgi:GDP-L-fucose synthase